MIINGVRWTVRMVSPAHPFLLTPWGTHAYGCCDKITQTIYIDKTLSKVLLKEIICHEIVHAFMYSYEIDLTYKEEELVAELISQYGEEIIQKTQLIYNGIKMK